MRKAASKLLFIFAALLPCIGFSQNGIPQLTEGAQVSLLTCDPGQDMYNLFGHSAVRISDPTNKIDRVYNYGTFDFDEPGFVWKFTRGKLNYKLSVTPWRYFLAEYEYEGRSVYENVMNLKQEEKQKLFELLEINYLPENAYYKYDFFFDNCATRIRDIIDKAVPEIQWRDSTHEMDSTLRDLLDIYLEGSEWADFGIDLGVGMPAEAQATRWQSMFLPDFLQLELAAATFSDREGNLMTPSRALYLAPKNSDDAPLPMPLILGWAFFAVIAGATFYGFKTRKRLRGLDVTLLTITGLTGWFICFLWFGTDHEATAANLNLIWANPLYFPIVLMSGREALKKPTAIVLQVYAGIALLSVVCWAFLPQDLHVACLPLALAIGIRSFVAAKNIQKS